MRALVFVFLALGAAAVSADPPQHRYLGLHPIAGGGICTLDGPHVHVYAPDALQYRDHDGFHVFVGDPTAYGYTGTRYTYKGHHPVHVHDVVGSDHRDVEFCYLDGPHYHAFAPPEGDLELVGEVYFYTRKPPKAYYDARPTLIAINTVYAPIVYTRPVVTVAAPVGWIGARVEVVAPAPPRARVEVQIPVPVVEVRIGGGVVIDRHHHHHHKPKHKHHKKHRHHHGRRHF